MPTAVMVFGIPVSKLELKPEYEEEYEETDTDLFVKKIKDLDYVWTGWEEDEWYIIGVCAGYPWSNWPEQMKHLTSETRAREYIARTLLPFVTQTKEKLRNLCDYYNMSTGEY